jgi:ubiquinone/menaquinone biosynthesis C-methylase UbiE/predicted DsbA family dithiol-disulfide isomerase
VREGGAGAGEDAQMSGRARPEITVIHFGDPWCWYSWGLEPVVQRLHEAYGDQVELLYRMGGVFQDLDEWRTKYGVSEDEALASWIVDTDKMMRNPFNRGYVLESGMRDTWKACTAVKAAQMQGEGAMLKFYRRLMEAIQIYAQDGSKEEVLLAAAKYSGLDPKRFSSDLRGEKAFTMFKDDRHAMARERGNFYSLIIRDRQGVARQVTGYTSEGYEKAIEEMTGGKLEKRTPIDIIDYFESRRGWMVTAREVAEVFKVDETEAERRLSGLSKSGLFRRMEAKNAGVYWVFPEETRAPKLTLEQVSLSHVTERAKVEDPAKLEEVVTVAVRKLYTEVAQKPRGVFHFPVGREGTKVAGYPDDILEKIPSTAVESFAGVGYPHGTKSISEGDKVLDVGSGSGTDLLVAAALTGPRGTVTGLDMTEAMIEKARTNVAKAGLTNAKLVKGDATGIPVDDSSVDVVTSNGVLNLVPDKPKAFAEIFRVLRPGGRLQLADIVTKESVQAVCGIVPQLWADCIGGASVEAEYLEMIRRAGFVDVKVVDRIDYFSKSPESTRRLTETFGAESVVIAARKPG